MKLASRLLSLLVLVAFAVFYISCDGGGGDDESQQKQQFNKLKSTWVFQTAFEDEVNRSGEFANAELVLSGTFVENSVDAYTYQINGTLPATSPWPRTGTWRFDTADPVHQVIRDTGDNEILMSYEVSETALEISFDIPEGHPGWSPGRTNSVTGTWVFTFSKKQ